MAGVGRRAFAALPLPHAAMYAQSHAHAPLRPHGLAPVDVSGANSLRTDSPVFLSPSSASGSPHSPHSPSWPSSHAPPPARTPSPLNPSPRPSLDVPRPSPQPATLSPVRRPSLPQSHDLPPPTPTQPLRLRSSSTTSKSSHASSTSNNNAPTNPPASAPPKLPFFERYKQLAAKPPIPPTLSPTALAPTTTFPTSTTSTTINPPPPPTPSLTTASSPTISSPAPNTPRTSTNTSTSPTELAYRRSNASSAPSTKPSKRPIRSPTDPGPARPITTASSASSYDQPDQPSRQPSPASTSSGGSKLSKSSGSLNSASGKSARSLDANTLDTLYEEPLFPFPHSPNSNLNLSSAPTPPLPQRSRTAPSERERTRSQRREERTCVKCGERIANGRWVQREGAGVLCERDWKEMYLPKCRRCELPIEKSAVSSSDGQLKGKYHPECFNCDACRKFFPDKTFYVLDGHPYCSYDYHRLNGSLCASPHCGQPIEGPCAVTHSGTRYHPEHLRCDERGCGERLEEYWEVGGRKLCERHGVGALEEEGERRAREVGGVGEVEREALEKTARRKTRFVDLVRGISAGKEKERERELR